MPRFTDCRHGPDIGSRIAAVVLAAGASQRLGRPKQLVQHDGEPLVRRAVAAALSAGCGPVWVVVPQGDEESDALALAIGEAIDGAETIPNPDWEEGMAASIRLGVRRAQESASTPRGLLLIVADQPSLTADPLGRLIAAFDSAGEAGPNALAACSYSGIAGVPALFGRGHWPSLEALSGDRGAREIVRSPANDCIHVAWPDGARDLDRPEDLEFTDL